MLTRSGWLVLVGAAVTLVAARLFGITELFTLGAIGLVLPLLALAWVRRRPPTLKAERVVHPRRVHLGGPSRVDLRITNTGPRRTSVLTLVDPVQGTVGARVSLPPLRPGDERDAGYRLPTDRRGMLQIGPLRAEVTDPFGLARRRFPVTQAASLTVLPAVEVLIGVPLGGGRDDPLAGLARRAAGGSSTDDFATLRPYEVGDDLRRVHWPSTARAGDLLVRQDDARWQGHVTVVLDTRADRIDGAPFEVAVSAAASVVQAVARGGDRVRLLLADGTDSGLVDARRGADTLLEHLALTDPHEGGSFPVLPSDGRQHTGTLVVLTGQPAPSDLATLAAGRSTYGTVVLVTVSAPPGREPAVPAGIDVVAVDPAHPFADGWAATVDRIARRNR